MIPGHVLLLLYLYDSTFAFGNLRFERIVFVSATIIWYHKSDS